MITEKLDLIISQIVEMHESPGLAVGIVKDDKIVYAKGFGVKNIKTKEPVSTTSLFHMASVSKPFVATAIVQLVERGQVDLDAPVIKYLPYFKIDDERYKNITVQQMLSHTSGMPDVEDYEWDKPQYDDGALERYVRGLGDARLLFAPGEKYAYSNIAFEVLGDLIAKVSGQSFADYVKENILNPLEMAESTFLKQEASPELLTTPHLSALETVVSDVYPYNRAHGPSSTLHSNVLEMCNWARANLNGGEFKGKRILETASYDLLWEPRQETGQDAGAGFVGLSWFIGEYRGHKTIYHSGGDVGYRTNFVMLPNKSAAIVVLFNAMPAPIEAVTKAALNFVLGFEVGVPRPPVLVSLRKTYLEAGFEATVEQCRRLQETRLDEYDFRVEQFLLGGFVLAEMGNARAAIDMLNLGLVIHPKSDDLLAFLALGYMKSGDKELALQNAKQALELNPQNAHAAQMLELFGQQRS